MENHSKNILDFLKFSEKLKTQLRDNVLSCGRKESVADHSWHLSLMAMLVEPHLDRKIDLLKTLKMVIIHDLAEAEIWDIPFSQSEANPEIKKEKKLKEEKELLKIKTLIGGELWDEIYNLWHELEEKKSPEAKFVKALDCMEANYQAILYGDITYWDDIYYEMAFTKSNKHCEHENILHALNEEIKTRTEPEMLKIGLNVDELKRKSAQLN